MHNTKERERGESNRRERGRELVVSEKRERERGHACSIKAIRTPKLPFIDMAYFGSSRHTRAHARKRERVLLTVG